MSKQKTNLTLRQIKEILRVEDDFKDINNWEFEHIPLGEMQHKYKVTKGKRIYFVKELTVHEAQSEYFLTKIKLAHIPCSKYPELIKKKILVRDYFYGKMLKNKKLDLNLIKDFVKMRNKLSDKIFFDKHNILD